MHYSLSMALQLFGRSFLGILLVFCIALLIVNVINISQEAYRKQLVSSFAHKQPHLKLKYISEQQQLDPIAIKKISQTIQQLAADQIVAISPYVSGQGFYHFNGDGLFTTLESNTSAKVIGISQNDQPAYHFMQTVLLPDREFNQPVTPVVFIYQWLHDSTSAVFNNALAGTFSSPLDSQAELTVQSQNSDQSLNLRALFQDFNPHPTLYTSIHHANALLNQPSNKIDGFLLNVKSLAMLNKVKEKLAEKLNQPHPTFVILSWLEERKKQHAIFQIFSRLSLTLSSVVLILSIIVVLLIQYRSIVYRAYHLNVLYTIGMDLKFTLFTMLVILVGVGVSLNGLVLYQIFPLIESFFNISLSNSLLHALIFDYSMICSVFLLLSYITIHSALQMHRH